MPFVRNEDRIQHHEQAAIDAGYLWPSRVPLMPYSERNDARNRARMHGYNLRGPNDRLNPHVHHSRNTHLIVKGRLTITTMHGPAYDYQYVSINRIDADNPDLGQREFTVNPGQWYRGEAGRDQSCIFIEAHKILSPGTAERFERRGDISWIADGESKHDWFLRERARGDSLPDPLPISRNVLANLPTYR